MKITFRIQVVLTLLAGIIAQAQDVVKASFLAEAWDVDARQHRFEEYKGKKALYLENGRALLKGTSFTNGTIEFDIAFAQKRNFAGINFHIQDTLNYEEYYLRPHQSGNFDAMQYTPVFNGNAAWQLYHGEGYWSAFQFRFNEWMHVKLIVLGNKMQVYIQDMEHPILNVTDLRLGELNGGIAFWTFLGAAHYANLTYQESDNVVLKKSKSVEDQTAVPTGVITSYEVSKAFPAKNLENVTRLEQLEIAITTKITTEPTGLLNLSRISPVRDDTNAILARFNIVSALDEEAKKLEFGYSDKVNVFVNGKLVYSGDNSFRSRDYRYLGSIGFYDAISLNLQRGQNEVVFAVTERMGGWGVMAKLSD
ncbi:MAG: hypothetical protein AAF634_06040 [Bacteroidota bacterium]